MVQIALCTLTMRKPKLTAVVPDDVYEFLKEWADRDQRSLSSLVAFVLTTTVRDMKSKQENEQQKDSPSPGKGERDEQN
jgi:hypothetical protein